MSIACRWFVPLLCWGLAAVVPVGASMPKPTPTLSITAQWDGRHDLLLRYVPPPGRTSLPFLITGPSGAQGWRSFMASAGDDCTELLPS